MSKPINFNNINSLNRPSNLIDNLCHNLHNTYSKFGDSPEGMHQVNIMTKAFYRDLEESNYYWNDLKPLMNDAVDCSHYHAYKLVDTSDLELSLHIMPRGTQLPMHVYENKFSLILMEQGTLNVEQNTYRKHMLKFDVGQNRLLNRSDTLIGLPQYNNMHKIKAISEIATYINIIVNTQHQTDLSLLTKLFSKRIISNRLTK